MGVQSTRVAHAKKCAIERVFQSQPHVFPDIELAWIKRTAFRLASCIPIISARERRRPRVRYGWLRYRRIWASIRHFGRERFWSSLGCRRAFIITDRRKQWRMYWKVNHLYSGASAAKIPSRCAPGISCTYRVSSSTGKSTTRRTCPFAGSWFEAVPSQSSSICQKIRGNSSSSRSFLSPTASIPAWRGVLQEHPRHRK